jgi:hypothetical protein
VYGDRARLHTVVAPASLPASFTVERSFDASKWTYAGQTAAVTDTRTTAVDFTVVPERNAYWRIVQRSGGTTLTSNAARILVSAKLSGPYLSNPLYFGKAVSIRGQIFPSFPVGSTAVQVVVRRWSNGRWLQDAILPAKILPNDGKATGHDWEARLRRPPRRSVARSRSTPCTATRRVSAAARLPSTGRSCARRTPRSSL